MAMKLLLFFLLLFLFLSLLFCFVFVGDVNSQMKPVRDGASFGLQSDSTTAITTSRCRFSGSNSAVLGQSWLLSCSRLVERGETADRQIRRWME